MEQFRFDLAAGPWWVYVLCILAAATLAIVTYRRTNPPLESRTRVALILLRTIGIACLVLLLF